MADARFSEDFWTDPKIRKLDHDTQRIFIYLFTNPHRNYCGLYYLPKAYMREGTGLSDRSIDRGIDTLISGGFIEYSDSYQMVFVKNMLKHQAPNFLNDNQIKGIVNHLSRLHRCPLIQSFLDTYKSLNINYSYTPIDTPLDTPTVNNLNLNTKSKSNIKIVTKISQKKVEIPLPENFTISDSIRSWAKAHNFNHLEDHLEWFRDWARANGKRKVDWDATFRNAIRGNWGKIDLSKPEIKTTRRTVCTVCGRYSEKCICQKEVTQ